MSNSKKVFSLTLTILIIFILSVIVLASDPIISQVVLNSSDGYGALFNEALDNENLTAFFNVSDSDGDSITNVTNWYVNNSSIMVLNMPFHNITNSTVQPSNFTKDYSSHGNNGTINGSLTFNATGGVDGFGAYTFDGLDDFIDVLDANSLDFGTGPFSLSAWVNSKDVTDVTSQHHTIFCKENPELASEWCLQILGAGDRRLNFRSGAASLLFSSSTFSNNIWYHVVVTRSSNSMKFYINGVLNNNATISSSISFSNSKSLRIGFRNSAYNGAWNGTIDQVQIWNRSLSAAQINLLYKQRNEVIHFNETNISNIWRACVTSNDRKNDSAEVCSNNVTIVSQLNVNVTISLVSPANNTIGGILSTVFNLSINSSLGNTNCTLYVDDLPVGNMTTNESGQYTIISNHTSSKKLEWRIECTQITTETTETRTYFQYIDEENEEDNMIWIPLILGLIGAGFLGASFFYKKWMPPAVAFIFLIAGGLISLNITEVVCETVSGVATCTTIETQATQLAYPLIGVAILAIMLLAIRVLQESNDTKKIDV